MTAVRLHDDDGVTLIELLAVIFIGAIVIAAIAGALLTGLRTNDQTTSRMGVSRDVQLLGTWLPVDVASAAPSGADLIAGTGWGCAGATPSGTNLVRLQYAADSSLGDDVKYANYRLEGTAPDLELIRYFCVAGGIADRTIMANSLLNATAKLVTASPIIITFTLTEPVKDTTQTTATTVFTYTAAGRTITTTPSPTTTPATTPGSTTTTTTTTSTTLLDTTAPTGTVTFPVNGASYDTGSSGNGSWSRESPCSPDGMCGSASDAGSGVSKVEVLFKRNGTTNKWWTGTGSAFTATSATWVTISGTTAWNLAWANASFPANDSYTVQFRFTDVAGNVSNPTTAITFTTT